MCSRKSLTIHAVYETKIELSVTATLEPIRANSNPDPEPIRPKLEYKL